MTTANLTHILLVALAYVAVFTGLMVILDPAALAASGHVLIIAAQWVLYVPRTVWHLTVQLIGKTWSAVA